MTPGVELFLSKLNVVSSHVGHDRTLVTFFCNRKVVFTGTGSHELMKMIQMRASEVITECLMQSRLLDSYAEVGTKYYCSVPKYLETI